MAETRADNSCPFCGALTNVCETKWTGKGMFRRLGAYWRCNNCNARGPLIATEQAYDVRNDHPANSTVMSIVRRAERAWRGDVSAIFPNNQNQQPDLFGQGEKT